jgi:tRNA(Ile)-lysidine synthase
MLPLQSFTAFIRQQQLFETGHRVLLTVSGGKDSVLMAHFFKQAGFDFGIAHCNFGLRGSESVRDEHFVHTLAAILEVPVFVKHFDTKAYAAQQQVSTQMAARELRYQWFEELRLNERYDRIATAHHQDDAVETVLLNLVRGTGIAGLHGILPRRGTLIRPLLFLSRRAIEELIAQNSFEYVEDSSNSSSTYARNKLRLEVIPLLKQINPGLEHTFEQNIRRFAETEQVLQQQVERLRIELTEEKHQAVYFSRVKVNSLEPKQLLLFELLKVYDFTEAVISEIIEAEHKQSGTSFYSLTHRLTIDREALIVSKISAAADHQHVMIHPEDQQVSLGKRGLHISYSTIVLFENDPDKAFVDADQLIFPLVLRNWQEGDRFMPIGMRNFKKLSDFFIDQKVPLPEKENIPIVINGNGEIVWVAGLRQDNRYKVTGSTKKVAIFEQKFN